MGCLVSMEVEQLRRQGGLQGTMGPQGPKGDKGDRGDVGPVGEQGPAGVQGPQGVKGDTGAQGSTGSQGPQGLQGIPGQDGAQGPQGIQGVKGDTGLQGLQGIQGIQGPAGGLLGSAALPATTGTMTANMATARILTITPTGACTFNASGGTVGHEVTFVITTSGTSSFVLTWGTGFRKAGTLATGTVSARFFSVSFVCVATTPVWQEVTRTVVLS